VKHYILKKIDGDSMTEQNQSVKDRVSPEEWDVRVQLAACYRFAAHFRMTDLIYTHISARVPGDENHFLLNAFGLMWDEVNASNLVKITLDGKIVDDPTGLGFNEAGFVIHSAIHGARHDVVCVMHTHTASGVAVSAQQHGLLPLSQHAMRLTGNVGYHEYEGVALNLEERERLVADIGDKMTLILHNHGLLTCGKTVREAFDFMYYLERACQIQIAALAGGTPVIMPTPEVAQKVANSFDRPGYQEKKGEWRALIRMLDRMDPSYKE
jgi:ribulose-5-phosphate 4-epimerase/fuculose-1-phosphate aldolase